MAELVEGDWKNFTFKMAEPEDYPRILKHLEDNFYLDEPTNKYMGKTEERYADMNLLGTEYMNQNLSFFAYDRENNNKIAGVRVTGISRKDGPGLKELIPHLQAEASKEIFPIFGAFLKEVDSYGKLGIDHYGDFLYMSVDREYRGFGLAQELYTRSFKLLKAKGIPACQSVFSNPISQAIARKFGFIELGRKYLKDYRKSDGSIFFPDAGEDEVQIVMAKML